MKSFSRCSAVLLAFASIVGPAATASAAPDPALVAQRHIAGINNVVSRAGVQFTNAQTATVRAVEQIDAKGGTNEQVIKVGDRGERRVTTLVTQNTNQVNRRTQNTLRQLERLGADEATLASVTQAQTAALASLQTSGTSANAAIDAAVAAATSN